jgi:hypothetical protein
MDDDLLLVDVGPDMNCEDRDDYDRPAQEGPDASTESPRIQNIVTNEK